MAKLNHKQQKLECGFVASSLIFAVIGHNRRSIPKIFQVFTVLLGKSDSYREKSFSLGILVLEYVSRREVGAGGGGVYIILLVSPFNLNKVTSQ